MDMEKLCKQCFEKLPPNKFYKNGKWKYYICKDCKSFNSGIQYQMRIHPDQKEYFKYKLLTTKRQYMIGKNITRNLAKIQKEIDDLRMLELPKFEEDEQLCCLAVKTELVRATCSLGMGYMHDAFIYSSEHKLLKMPLMDDDKWKIVKKRYREVFPPERIVY
jgi:hypothetical protein